MVQRPLVWGIGVFLCILIGVVVFAGVRQQTTFASNVLLAPEFGHIYCGVVDKVNDVVPMPTEKYEYVCGGLDQYMPYGCVVNVQPKANAGFFEAIPSVNWAVCSASATSARDSSCRKGYVLANSQASFTGTLDRGQKLFLDASSISNVFDAGDWVITATGDAYGLISQERGFLSSTQNCNTASLSNAYHPLEDVGQDIAPGVKYAVNYILGGSPITNPKNLIRDPQGNEVYVYSSKCFYPVKVTEDGVKYTDTRVPDCSGSWLKCSPGVYCSSDGRTPQKNPEGQSCDDLTGAGTFATFAPVSETEECTFVCQNGKPVRDDCRERVTQCPALTTYNPVSGACDLVDKSQSAEQVACRAKGGTWHAKSTEECDGLLCLRKKTVSDPYCDLTSGWAKALPWILSAVLVLLLLFVILKMTGGNQRGGVRYVQARRRR